MTRNRQKLRSKDPNVSFYLFPMKNWKLGIDEFGLLELSINHLVVYATDILEMATQQ